MLIQKKIFRHVKQNNKKFLNFSLLFHNEKKNTKKNVSMTNFLKQFLITETIKNLLLKLFHMKKEKLSTIKHKTIVFKIKFAKKSIYFHFFVL